MEIVVPAGQRRERLDVFLTHQIENATRSKVHLAIEDGHVLVDSKRIKPSHKVSPGEVITVSLPKPAAQTVAPEDIPIEIIHEDNWLLVVNKPAGMVTHPAYGNYSGTLVNALLHHCHGQLSRVGDVATEELPRPGIVHRLDKDTSGLMVIAKDEFTHAMLSKQFSDRTIDREYWALVWGRFKNRIGVIEAKLGRSKADRKKVAVIATGRHASTEYEVIEAFQFLSLVRLKLRTGRTHQIRVHLHHIGHPVFGDPTYGGRKIAFFPTSGRIGKLKEHVNNLLKIMPRQALHAKTLGFIHPTTKERMLFESDLPEDFTEILEKVKQ